LEYYFEGYRQKSLAKDYLRKCVQKMLVKLTILGNKKCQIGDKEMYYILQAAIGTALAQFSSAA
jgi:hypothetical protein